MPYDNNLKLASSSAPITGTGAQTAVDTEGGFRADVEMHLGVITDSNETFDITVEGSVDGGSNYFPLLAFEQFTNDEESKKITRTVYVPQPDSGQTKTKVRLNTTAVGGTTPSLPLNAWLVPLLSLAPPALDEKLTEGLAYLYT